MACIAMGRNFDAIFCFCQNTAILNKSFIFINFTFAKWKLKFELTIFLFIYIPGYWSFDIFSKIEQLFWFHSLVRRL